MRTYMAMRFFGALALLLPIGLAGPAQGLKSELPQLGKEIDEIEQRLLGLQKKLESIKAVARPHVSAAPVAKGNGTLPAHLERALQWRSIGPANMGGRITSLAVVENDPSCYYVATASGGLLKTVNNGSTFKHQFDRESTVSIGAVAVAPTNRNLVWVGTGEANPRNSVSYGDGVYRSSDGGETWQNMGLKKSFQIGKIVIHPRNPDVVYVAALGRLYGPSQERGLYKTTDGGKSWQRVWFHNDRTGVLDLVLHPANPEVMILAAWERQRDAFDSFLGDAKRPPAADVYAPVTTHGPGSGLFKSTDGGKTWTKLTQGLPKANMGRIGLDWHRKNPNLVFAVIDTDKAGMGVPPSKGFLGLMPETTKDGVQVVSVQKDSPAAKAKLAKGDLLVALDGKEIKKSDDFVLAMQPHLPGDKIKLTLQRGDKKNVVDVTLTDRPGFDPKTQKRGSLAVQVEEVKGGILIWEVAEGGAADKAGLKVGDVIVSLDGTKTDTLPKLLKLLTAHSLGDRVKLAYRRNGSEKEVEVTLAPVPTPPGRPFAGRLAGQAQNVQELQGPEGNDTGGIYRSTDAGATWTRINSLNERPFYFSVVRSDPNDEKTIYALGVALWRSTDGGKTFSAEGISRGVHVDHHDLWINSRDSRHLLLGNDGGVYVSYDRAANWEFLDHMALGQFYHVAVDNRRPYRVYGGLQDNGSWGGPAQMLRPSGPTNSDYQYVLGGDGFVCRIDPVDPDIVYAESQNGFMYRKNLRTGASKALRPKALPGAGRYRFNWNTPFILSNHNPSIFYAAANYVFRSVNRGEDLKAISPEITRTKRGSATALAESPRNADVLWVGSDDGAVWLTRDGGKNWSDVSDRLRSAGLPGPRWVASIEPSRAVTGRAYVVFDAHRSDDDEPYIFATDDYGQSWKSLRANLPTGPSRVLREDIKNPDLLYLGTELALYASLDRGTSWFRINGEDRPKMSARLPTVAVHEIAQPVTADEIVAGTHGRSLWVLDVTTLRQLRPETAQGPVTLFAPAPVTRWQLDFTREGMFRTGTRRFAGNNPPRQASFDFYLPKKAGKLSLRVFDPTGGQVRELDVAKEKEAGLHRVEWDLVSAQAPKQAKSQSAPFTPYGQPVKPATYRVVLEADGTQAARLLVVEPDPRTQTPGNIADEAEELRLLLKQQP